MKKERAKAVADVIRAASGTKKYKSTSAVILAAGNSTRMSGENKQFMTVGGLTVLARTILAFESANCINEIVVVTKKELIADVIDLCEKYSAKKVTAVVPGGENREESAWLGFSEISDKSDFVAIHDGARCLVTPEMIEKVCVAAYNYGAATAAHRSTDSVKVSGKREFIDETLDRDCKETGTYGLYDQKEFNSLVKYDKLDLNAIQLRVLARRVHRVLVDVESAHRIASELRGGNREDARAAAHVQEG